MKYLRYSIILLSFSTFINAQVVGQDAEGFSTIVLPSSNLYLDITELNTSFSFYKEAYNGENRPIVLTPEQGAFNNKTITDVAIIRDSLKNIWEDNRTKFNTSNTSRYFIFGGELTGGTTDGFSTLFAEGEFSTKNSITGLIGYNWYKLKHKHLSDSLINNYIRLKLNFYENELSLNDNTELIDSELNKLIRLGLLDSSQKNYYSFFNFETNKNKIAAIEQYSKEIKAIKIDDVIKKLKLRLVVLKKTKNIAKTNRDVASKIITGDQIDVAELELQNAQKIPEKTEDINKKKKVLDSLREKYKLNLQNKIAIDTSIVRLRNILKTLPVVGETVISEINTTLSNEPYTSEKWADVLKLFNKRIEILEYTNGNVEKTNFDTLISLYDKRIYLIKDDSQVKDLEAKMNKNKYYTRTIAYARGGYQGARFLLDEMNDATTIEDRFSDEKFDGYTLQLGVTHQFKIYNYLGFSASMSRAYNTATLNSNTFTFTKTDTNITEGTFSNSQEITALTGTYDRLLRFSLSADYVHLFSLKESSNSDDVSKKSHLYLSLNPYIRHHGYNRSVTIKNNTIFGIGLHAFNSNDNKLMGGVFMQSNDTFGANASTPNAVGNRFTFGLIAKFGFTGLKPETKP